VLKASEVQADHTTTRKMPAPKAAEVQAAPTTTRKMPAPKAADTRTAPTPPKKLGARADGAQVASAAATAAKATTPRPRAATRKEVYEQLAEKTGLTRKDVAAVFATLGELVGTELGKKGPGQFVVPGLVKLKVVRIPATKARPGRNPFTGEPMTFKARPAQNVVRAIPMKALKELV
jgi:nucleoid DNA-binding protein